MTAEISLQEQVLNDLAKCMSQEIDNQVICELLAEEGWTMVRAGQHHDYRKIYVWVQNNAQGGRHGYKHTWAFADSRDATAFWLVWA